MLCALNDRVIVRPEAPPERTSGGNIIIPDSAKDELVTIYATVLSVGPKVTQVTVGQLVVYNKWHGLDITHKGELLRSIREEELLAIDEGAEAKVATGEK